jgi:hypothetical protein
MSTVTYDATPAATAEPAIDAPARKGLMARILDRLIEARMQQAMNELRRHGLKLPRELDPPSWKVGDRSEQSLPFVR